jgi:hypothetical protein
VVWRSRFGVGGVLIGMWRGLECAGEIDGGGVREGIVDEGRGIGNGGGGLIRWREEMMLERWVRRSLGLYV